MRGVEAGPRVPRTGEGAARNPEIENEVVPSLPGRGGKADPGLPKIEGEAVPSHPVTEGEAAVVRQIVVERAGPEVPRIVEGVGPDPLGTRSTRVAKRIEGGKIEGPSHQERKLLKVFIIKA